MSPPLFYGFAKQDKIVPGNKQINTFNAPGKRNSSDSEKENY